MQLCPHHFPFKVGYTFQISVLTSKEITLFSEPIPPIKSTSVSFFFTTHPAFSPGLGILTEGDV